MSSPSRILSLILLIFCGQILCIQKYFDKPKPVNGTTLVIVVTLTLVDLNSIRVVDMDYRLDYYVVYEWNVSRTTCDKYVAKLMEDEYLTNKTDTVVLSGNSAKLFWVPDTYIEEAKQIKVPTLPGNNQYLTVKVKEDFTCSMKFDVRLAATVGCQMDFHAYPYDKQICFFRMRSHFNPLPFVKYQWNATDVTFETDMDLNDYDISYTWTQYNSSFKSKRFSWLEVEFVFQRKLSHFVFAATIPTLIIVLVAYSSFWVAVDTGPARFILTVTTFLTLTTQFAGLKSNLPPVSYITGLDIWMLGCMFFVFIAIIELAVVNYLDKKRRMKIEKRKQENEERKRLMKVMKHESSKNLTCFPTSIDHLHTKIQKEVSFSDIHSLNIPSEFHLQLNEIINEPDKGIKVDCVMRVLYPLAFIAFNVVYWPLLLTQKLLSK